MFLLRLYNLNANVMDYSNQLAPEVKEKMKKNLV